LSPPRSNTPILRTNLSPTCRTIFQGNGESYEARLHRNWRNHSRDGYGPVFLGRRTHRFSTVTIASSNQDVLDDSETVVIAVRPQVVREVLSELRFRPDHLVVSVVSSFPWQAIAGLVAPARRVTRAVPLPSTAKRLSPTAIYPPNHAIEDLFALLGAVYPVETEDEFDAVCAVTATIATYFAFANTTSTWLVRNGISEASARDYVARMMLGFTSAAVDAPEVGFQSLAREHATAGGINEQFLNHFLAAGLLEKVTHALDAVKERITAASKTL